MDIHKSYWKWVFVGFRTRLVTLIGDMMKYDITIYHGYL